MEQSRLILHEAMEVRPGAMEAHNGAMEAHSS
jgi:hypothetical protein